MATATLAVYWPVRSYEFVNYDDNLYVFENPRVKTGLNWQSVKSAFTTAMASNWHPVTGLSHILDVELFGLNAGAHHLVSLCFHIANSLLLFFLIKRMTSAVWASAFVAALFALHPQHVESVVWIAERKDVLSTFFGLLAILAWLRYALHGKMWWYISALLLFAMGLMAKPMLVTLPFLLLLLDYWPLERLNFTGTNINKKFVKHIGGLIVEKIPFFALSAVSSVITLLVQRHGGAMPAAEAFTFGTRALNAAVSYCRYIEKMLWPANLAVPYPHPGNSISTLMAGTCILLLVMLTALFLYFGRRKKYLAVGWLWYLGTLLPVIGLVQVGIQAMADRYTYLPSVGLFIIIALGFGELASRRPFVKPLVAAAAAIILAAIIVVTRIQMSYWQNSVKLFEHTLEVTENNFVAYNNLGSAYSKFGRYDKAIELYIQALKIMPNHTDVLYNLGTAYFKSGKYREAIACYTKIIGIKSDFAGAYSGLGAACNALGRYEEAVESFTEAIRIKPDNAEAHNNLGVAYGSLGRYEQARESCRQAVTIEPNYAEAHNNLGNACLGLGLREEVVESYRQAIKIKPDFADAYNNLGTACNALGRHKEAIESCKQAIRIKHGYAHAHLNLGVAYVMIGDRDSALKEYELLKTLDSQLANQLLNLIHNTIGLK